MAFSDVSKFLANFDGGARPNRYKVTLDGTPGAAGQAPDQLTFLCRASSIPASIVAPCIVAYMGREVKVPGDRSFDDWTVTVYNTKDMMIRKYFETWSSNILMNFNNTTPNEEEAWWMGQALVQQLDRGEHVTNTYKVRGIFPTSVGDIALAYDNNNTVEEFQVTFTVNYWVSEATDED